MYDNPNFVDCNRLSILDQPPRPQVITIRPGPSSSLKEITVIRGPRTAPRRPTEITLVANNDSFAKLPEVQEDPLSCHSAGAKTLAAKKIPRPPNAFMIFANEWRKRLAAQYPQESNKCISVRLGRMWKDMAKTSKEVYYQRSKQAGQDHKLKYPGYIYNPKEARIRKALREQSRGVRNPSVAPPRWNNNHVLIMNRPSSFISPVLLPQSHVTEDSKAMLHEQVERDHSMLQSYPDYVDLPYNVPSTEYPLDTHNWYPSPYNQPGGQPNGAYMNRTGDSKLAVDWSTPYNSEQGNFIRASPQSSPFSGQNHSEVNSLMMNGDSSHQEQPTTQCDANCLLEHKPVMDPIISQNGIGASVVKDPEQHVKELLASAKVIPEDSPLVNGKQEDSGSMKLPGFHQAFGSTEIGRFSQPDGFFEAAVAAENERKVCMSPLPPPPPKRGRAPRGGRKAKSRVEPEKWPDPCFPGNMIGKKEPWQEWNPGMQPGCGDAMNSLQRMNCYPYHEERPPMVPDMYNHNHPQWHPDMPYYERQNCNQYYPPYYNPPPQEPVRSYHDCYPPYDYPPPGWRGHPYYHPSHYPHHQNVGYYQQYSEYRHYGYQNNRWAVNREIKYSSGMV